MITSYKPGVELDPKARERLERELSMLREQRAALEGIKEAPGDRADHAELLVRQDDAAMLDDKINEMSRLLAGAVPSAAADSEALPDGAMVILRHGDGMVQALRAVALTAQVPPGEEESSLTLDSPLGKALAGHKAGDTVSYQTPDGPRRAEIIQIQPPG